MTLDVITAARRRTRRRLGVAVAVVVVCGAGLVYPAGLYVDAHLTAPVPPPPSTMDTTASGGAGSTAGVLPADVQWVRVAGVDLPESVTAGPHVHDGGLVRGFAHTRTGAVVAGLHLLVRTSVQVGPAVFDPTITAQVTGPAATAMRQAVTGDYTQAAAAAGTAYGQPLGDLPATLAGLRVEEYTPARAVLSVLTRATDAAGVTRYAATTITVLWQGGDWLLLAPPGGRWDALVHLVDDTQTSAYPPLSGR